MYYGSCVTGALVVLKLFPGSRIIIIQALVAGEMSEY